MSADTVSGFLDGALSSPVWRWFKSIGALPFMEPGSVVDVWTNDIVGNLPQEMNEFFTQIFV